MAINSRQKGAAAERELAKALRDYGYDARRGQQFAGGGDSPDVVGLPGFHIECKRVEAGNLYNWLKQAQRDAKPGNKPVVIHRRNQEQWVAILTLDDFIFMVKKLDSLTRATAPFYGTSPALPAVKALAAEQKAVSGFVQHVGQRGPAEVDEDPFPGYSDLGG